MLILSVEVSRIEFSVTRATIGSVVLLYCSIHHFHHFSNSPPTTTACHSKHYVGDSSDYVGGSGCTVGGRDCKPRSARSGGPESNKSYTLY